MINSIVRLKDLCEILISMGFSESVNEKEVKDIIARLETIISEEIKLLKEHESTSDWEWGLNDKESMDSTEKAVTSLNIPLPYDPLIKQRGLPCSHPPSGERGFFICKGFWAIKKTTLSESNRYEWIDKKASALTST